MTSTVVSWGLTLALVGVVTYLYKPDIITQLLPKQQTIQTASTQVESALRPSNKRSKSKKSFSSKIVDNDASTPTSSNETASKKRKIVSTTSETSTGASQAGRAQPSRVDEEDLGDKEFAQQLAKTQAGTSMQKSENKQTKSKGKAGKQSQANRQTLPAEDSSTAEQVADDELSNVSSPPTELINGHGSAVRAGDVTDMLEAPAAKPTTLRLTGITDESKNKKPVAKTFEPVMTKKQRQQQAKKEEMRQMREESDRIHEAKKQEQLRRARMADGTSNQTKANNFGSSTTNAWQSKSQDVVKAAPAEPAPLLDTFDPSSISAARPNGSVHTQNIESSAIDSAADLKDAVGEKKASAMTASSREGLTRNKSDWADEMFEEDQMKLLKQQNAEDTWEDVTTKKTRRKNKKENDSASETNSSVHKSPPTVVKPQSNGVKTNNVQQRPEATNRFESFHTNDKGVLADADWEA